jgi:hypothetical protein
MSKETALLSTIFVFFLSLLRPTILCSGFVTARKKVGGTPMAPNLNPVTSSARAEALETVQQLKDALARHGIVLPSLDVDLVSYTYVTRSPLVELGRCNQETARALAAVLNKAKEQTR